MYDNAQLSLSVTLKSYTLASAPHCKAAFYTRNAVTRGEFWVNTELSFGINPTALVETNMRAWEVLDQPDGRPSLQSEGDRLN